MEWLKRLFRSKEKAAKPEHKMVMTSEQADKMLRMIEHTQDKELSCDEVFEFLGEQSRWKTSFRSSCT